MYLGWGLIPSDVANGKVSSAPNTKYYVIAHYSRHVRPGCSVLNMESSQGVACFRKASNMLNIVFSVEDEGGIDFDLNQFSTVNGPVTRW